MGWKRRAVAAFDRLGGNRVVARWFGRDRLTVLAYHRVVDPHADDFVGLSSNVSASPDAFAEQMRWVARNATPVAMSEVVAALEGASLPERSVLVTFDDGYLDNHDTAWPILREHGIPGTIFLATDHIGSDEPFWWDRVAWTFWNASHRPDTVALLGPADWTDPRRMSTDWVEAAKRLPRDEKLAQIDALEAALRPPDPAPAFARTHLDWGHVRTMHRHGVGFGAHTCSHPILTSVAAAEAAREIEGSVRRIGEELGAPPESFAYPNGLEGDFDDAVVGAVAAAGIRLAFTLIPGPARLSELRADPLRVRRVYVHHHDDLARFKAKVAGIPRLLP
jgi:peptidoglycan/xylan/chitin deacetylase (PgdA/CDA1 family)